jgi:hypothetical protein
LIIKLSEKGGEKGFLGSGDRAEIEFHETISKRRKGMKKILNTVLICTLTLVFLSTSDVFAVDTTKLENKEFKINGLATRYSPDGYNGSGQITQGVFWFGNPEYGVDSIHNIASDLLMSMLGGYPELYCLTHLGPYTPGVDKINSTECSMACYDPAGNEVTDLSFEGSCSAKILFSSKTAFTGTITLPDLWDIGSPYVLTFNGKFMGKYAGATDGTSLRDKLRNRTPEGVRKSFQK